MSFLARFAIAPTGLLTVAQARLALANRDLAHEAGGACALRFDDLGRGQGHLTEGEAGANGTGANGTGANERIRQDLRWLGIAWDAEFHQSERRALYDTAIARLQAARRLYPCFENEAELRAKRERRIRVGKAPVYDRAMLKLTPAQRAAAEANGKRPHWRFLLSDGEVVWKEPAGGKQAVKLRALSDPILLRADGGMHASLTAAVDDIDMGVGLLARGADDVSSSAIQYDIRAALGANPGGIAMSHLPSLVDATQGRRARALEKLTIHQLRQDGIEAAALVAYLGGLRTDPRFDSAALLGLNRRILSDLSFADVAARLPEIVPQHARNDFWHAIRGHIDLLPEARLWAHVVAGEIVPPILDGAVGLRAGLLAAARDRMPDEPWDGDTWRRWLAGLGIDEDHSQAGLLRLVLTGEEAGPPMEQILPLIGRARAGRRLEAVSRAE